MTTEVTAAVAVNDASPRHTIHHLCYFVEDIPRAVAMWTKLYGAGPFHMIEHIELGQAESPFGRVVFDHSAAFGLWGDVAVELQQIHEIAPVELRDIFCARPCGPNHVAYVVPDRKRESERLSELGLPAVLHVNGPVQVSYHTVPDLGHPVEVMQESDFLTNFFAGLRAERDGWDGNEPLRVDDI